MPGETVVIGIDAAVSYRNIGVVLGRFSETEPRLTRYYQLVRGRLPNASHKRLLAEIESWSASTRRLAGRLLSPSPFPVILQAPRSRPSRMTCSAAQRTNGSRPTSVNSHWMSVLTE